MKKTNPILIALFILLLDSPPTYGEDPTPSGIPELSLDDFFDVVVTTASKKPQKLSEAPSNISVITSQQIREWGCRDLQDVLRHVVNVPVLIDRDEWVYAIRGNISDNNSKYLILIDGHRMNSLENFGPGHIIESPFNMSNVARVEVIRGPGSAVWGPDALAGVINILTKTASDLGDAQYHISTTGAVGNDLSIQTGKQEFPMAGTVDFQMGKKISDKSEIMLMGSFGASEGFNIVQSRSTGFSKNLLTPDAVKLPIPGTPDTATYPGSFATKVDQHTPGFMLQLKGKMDEFKFNAMSFYTSYYNRQIEYGYGRTNYLTASKTFVELGWEKEIGELGTFTTKISADINREEYQPGSQDDTVKAGQINIVWLDRRHNISTDYLKNFGEKVSISAGLDYSYTIAGPNQRFNAFYPNITADSMAKRTGTVAFWIDPLLQDHQTGGYVQGQYSPVKQITLVLGMRGDYNQERGNDPANLNPRAAIMFFPLEGTTIKALYNRGYLRPTNFNSAFAKDSLVSEIMDQGDLVIMQQIQKLSITADVFYQQLKGFINLFPGSNYNFRNTADYTSMGLELELKYAYGSHDLWANYYYTDASAANFAPAMAYNNRRTDQDGKMLTYPPQIVNSGLTLRLLENKLSISPNLRAEGPAKYRLASVTKESMDNSILYAETEWMVYANLTAVYSPIQMLDISLFGNNLNDNRDQKPQTIWNGTIGQPGPEIGLKLTLKI